MTDEPAVPVKEGAIVSYANRDHVVVRVSKNGDAVYLNPLFPGDDDHHYRYTYLATAEELGPPLSPGNHGLARSILQRYRRDQARLRRLIARSGGRRGYEG